MRPPYIWSALALDKQEPLQIYFAKAGFTPSTLQRTVFNLVQYAQDSQFKLILVFIEARPNIVMFMDAVWDNALIPEHGFFMEFI